MYPQPLFAQIVEACGVNFTTYDSAACQKYVAEMDLSIGYASQTLK